jgi:hypothetical protein
VIRTRDELGTDPGCESEGDREERCYSMPYLSLYSSLVQPFFREIKSSPLLDNLLTHFPFRALFTHLPLPLFREIKVSVRFVKLPPGTQLIATGQSSTATRIPLPTCDLYDMMHTKLLPAHPPSKSHARERQDKISPFVCRRNSIQHGPSPTCWRLEDSSSSPRYHARWESAQCLMP